MMNVKILPHELSGLVTAPVSKSEAHRLLICAALSDKPVRLFIGNNGLEGLPNDITATINCLHSLGTEISLTPENFLNIKPLNPAKIPGEVELDCQESGSTMRFILPVAAALCEHVRLKGSGRLPDRPVNDLITAMESHGVKFSSRRLPFEVSGKLQAGTYDVRGDVSSQYISGLMLAAPLLEHDSVIKITSELKSAAYVDITLASLEKFKIAITREDNLYKIPGHQKFLSPGALSVGGDWSGAAFFLTAGALSGPVSVTGLSINSAQGDKKILELLQELGADVKINNKVITVSPVSETRKPKRIEIDIDSTPDLFPVLAIAASCSDCEVKFYNASRLRLKESDRIAATASIIRSLGGFVEEDENSDEVLVKGNNNLNGGFVEGCNDHRIVMAAAVAGIKCDHEVIISDAESVKKSYPEFFRDYSSLGGCVNVV